MGRFRLAQLQRPREEVELPNGRVIEVAEIDAATFQMARDLQADPSRTDLIVPVLRRLLPKATEEEIGSLTTPMISAVVQLANGEAEEVYKLLGESSGTVAASDSPVSSPAMTSASSVPV